MEDNGSKANFLSRLQAAAQGADETERRSALADPAAYDGVFERISHKLEEAQRRLAREQKLARTQWEALEKHPQARRLVRIRNDRRFQTWGFYQFLLVRSRHLAGSGTRAAEDAAELALAVARCLDPAEHGKERIADFEVEALAAWAEAKRQRNDLGGAWESFAAACERLENGTGDTLEKAELELLRERLLRDFGREEEANWAHQRAKNLFRWIGDFRLEGGGAATHSAMHGRGRG